MQYDEKIVNYPSVNPGTEKTSIRFYSGKPDLQSVFYADTEVAQQRIFVTDTSVASLSFMYDFISKFKDDENKTQIKQNWTGRYEKDLLVILGPGEKFKTIESVLFIIKTAIDFSAQRSALFVGIGGGVITDMTAFASSIFKRGAHVELVPTTLLSMVDAAVGGKTGCDFSSYKNMIGTFFPAQKIHIMPFFITTLPESEYRSGMAEVVKTAALYRGDLFTKIENNPQSLKDRTSALVNELIKASVNAKAKVVEQDLTEKNIRMLLNLGHTFGHALESCAGLGTISHGDAVAWGMARAAKLSLKLKLTTRDYCERMLKTLSAFGWETACWHPVLQNTIPDKNEAANKLFSAMQKDKKNSTSKVKFILQRNIEDTVITEVEQKDVISVLLED